MSEYTLTPLRQMAHARAGDKGNTLNISLICYRSTDYPLLAEQMTPERVKKIFRTREPSHVTRYDLPELSAFNFVISNVLEGGVNRSLGLDGHGKSLSFQLLKEIISVPRTHK